MRHPIRRRATNSWWRRLPSAGAERGVEVRSVVQLSLTFDQRVCNGGTAASFLRHVIASVSRP
ncbi:2-oxo acid dehydrogenase subunit E2 [Streptomyces sp. NPDC051987]|uniref:2-oxo acid dehydrogenase subunit E2 n=1 Tax=Streptomyces sp. NPDC051987 TaxID=3155808 RepID=UPI003442B337